MKVSEKVTKTEALLLAMTLVFLLLTGAIFVLRSRSGGAEYVVRNETMRAAAEETPPASVLEEEPPVPSAENPLNINMADAAALDTLPGIGPVLAGRIVEYRSTHGAFSKKEDLSLIHISFCRSSCAMCSVIPCPALPTRTGNY